MNYWTTVTALPNSAAESPISENAWALLIDTVLAILHKVL